MGEGYRLYSVRYGNVISFQSAVAKSRIEPTWKIFQRHESGQGSVLMTVEVERKEIVDKRIGKV